jgi:hypothetical protein
MWAYQDPPFDSVICENGFAGDDTATTLTMWFMVFLVLFALWLRHEDDPDWRRRRATRPSATSKRLPTP